jgi:hypothetical protein
MRLPTRTGLLLASAFAVVALPTGAGALPAGPSTPAFVAANSTTYQDSTGEDPQGADITTIVVSNDDSGMVTFRINIPNRPQLGQDIWIDLYVDSDANAMTGDPNTAGVDYVFQLIRGEINLYRWDGTGFTRRFGDPSAVTLTFSYQGGVTIRISAAELGNTRRFNFFTEVVSGVVFDPVTAAPDCTNCHLDSAPASSVGLYAYTVIVARPTLVVRRLTRTPAAPAAGKTFSLRMTAARSDTGAVLQNGRVTCVARAGTARLRAQVARVQGRAVVCTWRIPANAKGRTFRGSVAVVFEGLRASRSYSARIR